MKKYFVRLRNKQYGPATIEELKRMGIDRSTLVWYKGLAQWTPAGQVPEISDALFGSAGAGSSASASRQVGRQQQQRKRQTSIDDIVKDYADKESTAPRKAKFVLLIAVMAVVAGIVAYQNQRAKDINNTEPLPVIADTVIKKDNMEGKITAPKKVLEAIHPENFITIDASLANATVSGTVFNTASVTTYKNIVLTIYYMDAEGTNIDLEEYTVPDIIKPGRSANFSFKPKLPKGTKTINTSFSTAEAVK
jgi:hypothetical protein